MDISQLGTNILTSTKKVNTENVQPTRISNNERRSESSFKDVMGQDPQRGPAAKTPATNRNDDQGTIETGVEKQKRTENSKTPELVNNKSADQEQVKGRVERTKDSLRIEKALDKKIGELIEVSQSLTPSTPQKTAEIEGLSQQVSMLHFLQKMEDEIGIAPDKIIAAFGELQHADLLAPPKESMGSFIEKLQLNGPEKERAQVLFEQMLNVGAGEQFAQQIRKNDGSISMGIQDQETFKKAQLSSSIDVMAQKFFMDGQFKRPALSKTAAASAYGQMAVNSNGGIESNSRANSLLVDSKATQAAASSIVGAEEMTAGLNASSMTDGLQAELAGKNIIGNDSALNSNDGLFSENFEEGISPQLSARLNETSTLDKNMTALESHSLSSDGSMDLNELMEMGMDTMSVDDLNVDFDNLSESANSKLNTSSDSSLDQSIAAVSSSDSSQMSDEESSEHSNQEEQFLSQYSKIDGKKTSNQVKTNEFVLDKPVASDAQKLENVREIVNRAQFLASKGGGEMKVRLNPEGLGEINLKVAMQGQSLNVEMVASNDDAKELIEKGLGELKATLASQKINVDDIKVDVSAELRNELNDQQDQAERNFQQKFLQEFSNRNNSFRHSMMDLPDLHHSKGSSETDRNEPLLPSDKSEKGSKRLNLVA